MEKLLYPLWKPEGVAADDFRDQLLSSLGPQLVALDQVKGVRLCVADSAVADAAGRRMENNPPLPEAMLSVWADYAGAATRWEPLIDRCVSRLRHDPFDERIISAGWLPVVITSRRRGG